MKNTKITIMFGIVLALALMTIVSAESYCTMSLTNGQSIPADVTSSTEHLSCDGEKCLCTLSSGQGFCQVCTDSKGEYESNPNRCKIFCNTTSINDTEDLYLITKFPFPDGGVFTKQTFFMDISTNKIANIDLIDNVLGKEKNLCPNCNSYKKSTTFKQGFNNITIRAVYGDKIREKTIAFFIDNKAPRITKTLPLANKYADGNFIVYYDENNVKEVTLYYGPASNIITKKLTGCLGGKTSCSTEVSLDEFDGQQINYWFEIKDIANKVVSSKQSKILVDTSMPIINSFSYSVSKTYVTFKLNVTEKNLSKIIYYDNDDPRAKVLCTSLPKNGVCEKKFSFKKGEHSISINIMDKAGNTAGESFDFVIN